MSPDTNSGGNRDLRRDGVVVVGASIAGISAVDAFRAAGFEGPITVIGAEARGPYARPPLSKGVLAGSLAPESTLLPVSRSGAQLRTGVSAVGLDPDRRSVTLDDGDELRFGGLVIATGSRARRLDGTRPATDPGEELVLRTLDDAVRLRDRLCGAGSVVVVGGGLLGMEIASSALGLGLEVTVVDLRPPLVAALGPFLAAVFARAAREQGVRIRVASAGVALLNDGDGIAGVVVDGVPMVADLVVTAIGDLPNVEWLDGAGLAVSGGVVVDEWCRVGPGIVAAGDVAVMPVAGRLRRMPFWGNAIAQAQCAVRALLNPDGAEPYRPEPYYWTDAFGVTAKVAGDLPAGGEPEVLAGAVAGRSALLRWTDDGLRTAAAVNHQMSLAGLRRLVTEPSV